ncbi:hypothetical protein sos41_05180 [Alphaproteobacteria bacterium SO-S41]|nr:hypothetical protein sos41_05180 [Alphaproteobacteria bacterium SO-S41]
MRAIRIGAMALMLAGCAGSGGDRLTTYEDVLRAEAAFVASLAAEEARVSADPTVFAWVSRLSPINLAPWQVTAFRLASSSGAVPVYAVEQVSRREQYAPEIRRADSRACPAVAAAVAGIARFAENTPFVPALAKNADATYPAPPPDNTLSKLWLRTGPRGGGPSITLTSARDDLDYGRAIYHILQPCWLAEP